LEPIPELTTSAATNAAGVPVDPASAGATVPAVAQSLPDAAQMMQMFPQLFGSLPGQNSGAGSGDPGSFGSLPPEVFACFQSWTQPDSFSAALAQAVQPPLSDAYLSGDATGSHHVPQLPEVMEFLPLRWQRTAGRCEGLQEVPEPPDLSRAYLSAFLRGLGQHVRSNAAFASMPASEQLERYPSLSHLASFFNPHQASGTAPETSAPVANTAFQESATAAVTAAADVVVGTDDPGPVEASSATEGAAS